MLAVSYLYRAVIQFHWFVCVYVYVLFVLFLLDMDINVRLETEKRTYIVGEPVEFRCILEVQNVAKRYFSISWAFNSSLIATFAANAVPVLNNEFAQREALGQLKVAKESDSVYILKIYRLRLEDSGKYNCRVTERLKTTTGEFIDGESKRPKNTPITVLPLSKQKSSLLLLIVWVLGPEQVYDDYDTSS